jgi:excisionase family DNA binding protein
VSKRPAKSAPPTARVLKPHEVAARLNISVKTVYRLLKKGKLPAFRIGADWRFNVEQIDLWRLAQTKEQMSDE